MAAGGESGPNSSTCGGGGVGKTGGGGSIKSDGALDKAWIDEDGRLGIGALMGGLVEALLWALSSSRPVMSGGFKAEAGVKVASRRGKLGDLIGEARGVGVR